MKKRSISERQVWELVNKTRNESQKSVLLCFLLNNTMAKCTSTMQHARELRDPKLRGRRKA